ncbi:predicted protein [Histoplasma capsulatum G186AR]|uniref:Uncharacterized protein n=1 Tax=Ajellomyces capsulatus (strain G186AR / H82 / ATCC MYA-2454 / RMSCC 2432) TaxID=447093 RepID=C0NAW1_AJECG|nr:uncharacterized protein HCBG_00257 [Histoplasma capsulatum G186AR]EEH10802.1 predicted protein [Histoplasma capsulatum G186AR]
MFSVLDLFLSAGIFRGKRSVVLSRTLTPFFPSSSPILSCGHFLWSLPSRLWPTCDKHSWIEEHPQSSLDVLSSKDHVSSPVFLDHPALSGNSASSTSVFPPLYPSTYANWPHNATTRHLLVQPPVELSRYLSRTFQIDLLRRRAAVSVSFLSGFFHEINPGLMASRYACRACLPPPGQPVLPLSPKLSPYPPSVEMSSKSSSVVSCGHVQTDVVAFPPTKGISLNSPPSEGINHQEECPQRIPDGNNQPGSTPPAQRQPSNWDTKDPQTKASWKVSSLHRPGPRLQESTIYPPVYSCRSHSQSHPLIQLHGFTKLVVGVVKAHKISPGHQRECAVQVSVDIILRPYYTRTQRRHIMGVHAQFHHICGGPYTVLTSTNFPTLDWLDHASPSHKSDQSRGGAWIPDKESLRFGACSLNLGRQARQYLVELQD